MKVYHKKQLLRGISLLVVAVVLAIIPNVAYETLNPGVIMNMILLFVITLCGALWCFYSAFNKEAARRTLMEEEDERKQLVKQKTGSMAFDITSWSCIGVQIILYILWNFTKAQFLTVSIITLGAFWFFMLLVQWLLGIIYNEKHN